MIAPIDLFAPLRGDPALADWVCACSTRAGGVSDAPFDSLNLGFSTADDPERIRENRRRLADAVALPIEDWVVTGQRHGAEVRPIGRADRGEGALAPSERLRGWDAVLIAEPGVAALALSADCPIIAVVDPEHRRGGLAHAGWRGTAAGVVEALLAALRDAGTDLASCAAAIGPGICGHCYEVGEEVFASVEGRPGAGEARHGRTLDLRHIHRAVLEGTGVPRDRIAVAAECSAEDPRFFSHRGDGGRTGRQGVIAGWRPREGSVAPPSHRG